MALAYGNFHELSHQLRFLLFEIGVGLSQNAIDYYITLAHKESLKRLQHAALTEGLINKPIASHHVHDFIDQLRLKLKTSLPESHFFQWDLMREELDESIANDALIQAYIHYRTIQLRNEAHPYPSLWSWLTNQLNSAHSLSFLGQWGCMGHPYLPAFQVKKGLNRREVLQNSPEFQSKISIHWAALKKDRALISLQSSDFNVLMASQYPREYALWREKLILNHVNPNDYYPVPLHPWQWRNQLQTICGSMLDSKSLILLPHHQTLVPILSFNTMLSLEGSQCLIQLATTPKPCQIQNEILYEDYTDETVFTHWLHTLLTQENHFENTLFVAQDLGGIWVHDESIPSYYQSRLSVRLHQNPLELITEGQRPVPLTSLLAYSPITNTPLLCEIIKESGLDPFIYFSKCCQLILHSQLHLLLKYGVALETNDANTLFAFTQQMPQSVILLNMQQSKIAKQHFFNDTVRPEFSPNAKMVAEDMNELTAFFIQNTLQNLIHRLIMIFSNEYQFPLHQLWNQVKEIILHIFNKLSADIQPDVLKQQRDLILHAPWQHQCLLTMQLSMSPKNRYVKHENPWVNKE